MYNQFECFDETAQHLVLLFSVLLVGLAFGHGFTRSCPAPIFAHESDADSHIIFTGSHHVIMQNLLLAATIPFDGISVRYRPKIAASGGTAAAASC
jgi:hypothetical protein